MNGFEKHNLKHTSPSQINLWAEAPCAWVAKYLYGHNFSFGVAAQVGTLTEQVVAQVIMGEKTFDEALALATSAFNRSNALNTSEKERERVNDIKPMAELALEFLKPYGVPEFERCVVNGRKQKAIELTCNGDGWTLPIIGYTDFEFPQHGVVFDLKTTLRIPSVMGVAHKRQGAIYKKASGNKNVKFLYCSPKKAIIHDIENEIEILQDVKNILNRQERFLRLEKDLIKEIVPINTSSFYWSDSEHIRKELFNI